MEETAQETSTTLAPEAPSALTPEIAPVHTTYQVGMVPAVRWICTCKAQNLNLDPRAVQAARSRKPIQDKCPACGALAYVRPQLIIEKVPTVAPGKVLLK